MSWWRRSEQPLGDGLRAVGIDDWYLEFDLRDSFVHFGSLRRRSFADPDGFLGFLIVQRGGFGVTRWRITDDMHNSTANRNATDWK
jgi:hypothetical protein